MPGCISTRRASQPVLPFSNGYLNMVLKYILPGLIFYRLANRWARNTYRIFWGGGLLVLTSLGTPRPPRVPKPLNVKTHSRTFVYLFLDWNTWEIAIPSAIDNTTRITGYQLQIVLQLVIAAITNRLNGTYRLWPVPGNQNLQFQPKIVPELKKKKRWKKIPEDVLRTMKA